MSIEDSSIYSLSTSERYQIVAGLLVGRPPAPSIADEAEWTELLNLVEAEGAGPLLSHTLRELPEIDVPPSIRERLASFYLAATYDSLLQEAVRVRLCRRLQEQAVPALLLKGAALALTCYDDRATRPMVDLDLLVPRSRLAEAACCLEEEGFRLYRLPRSLIPLLNRPWIHLVYIHPTTRAVVELHWEIQALARVQAEALAEIWAHAQPVGSDGPARMMRLGHAMPLLCAHMALQHKRASLLWLYDLHRVLLAADDVDIVLARDAAERWRLGPCTALALLRVRELFGAPLPEPLARWAMDRASGASLQARVAALALTSGAGELPDGRLLNLVINGDWRLLRSLLPAPEVVRRECGLSADESVTAAYVARLARRLRHSPDQLRRLWRCWRAPTRPQLPHSDLPPSGGGGAP